MTIIKYMNKEQKERHLKEIDTKIEFAYLLYILRR